MIKKGRGASSHSPRQAVGRTARVLLAGSGAEFSRVWRRRVAHAPGHGVTHSVSAHGPAATILNRSVVRRASARGRGAEVSGAAVLH